MKTILSHKSQISRNFKFQSLKIGQKFQSKISYWAKSQFIKPQVVQKFISLRGDFKIQLPVDWLFYLVLCSCHYFEQRKPAGTRRNHRSIGGWVLKSSLRSQIWRWSAPWADTFTQMKFERLSSWDTTAARIEHVLIQSQGFGTCNFNTWSPRLCFSAKKWPLHE